MKGSRSLKLNREGHGEYLLGASYTFNETTGEVTANQAHYLEKVDAKWVLKLPLKPGDAEKYESPHTLQSQPCCCLYAKLCGELIRQLFNSPIVIVIDRSLTVCHVLLFCLLVSLSLC